VVLYNARSGLKRRKLATHSMESTNMNGSLLYEKAKAVRLDPLRAKVSDRLFYGLVILGLAGAGASALTGDYGLWAYLTGTGLGGALIAASRPRLAGPCVCGDELAAAITAAERSGFDEGVRFGVEWEDHHLRRAEPLSEDHVFDGFTLVMKPRRKVKKRGANNAAKRLRVIQASGRLYFFEGRS